MPFCAMRSRWLPRSMMWPWSSTMMTSEFWTVDRRCAMTNTVRPFIKASMPDCTMASVRVSMEDVASSRIMTGGSATAARAMEMSWRWPWTFYKENGYIRLQPENDNMDPIIVDDCTIVGKAYALYRKIV